MILLTDEKIHELWLIIGDPFIPRYEDVGRRTALAQLKKVYELINKVYNEDDSNLRLALAYLHQALQEEAGLDG